MARIFMDVFKIGEFLSSGIVNGLRSAHWINGLEALLQSVLSLLTGLILDNELVLIGDTFEDYIYCFTYCLVMLFFLIQHYIYEDVWYESYSRESFFYEIFSNGFKCRVFSLLDSLLVSLLAKLVHDTGFPS